MPWQRPAAAPEPPPWQPDDPTDPAAAEALQRLRGRIVAAGIGLAILLILVIQTFAFFVAGGENAPERDEALAALIATLVLDVAALVVLPYYLLGGRRAVWGVLGVRRPSLPTLGWAFAGLGLAWAGLLVYLLAVDVLGIDELEPVSTIDDDVIYDHVHLVVLVVILAVLVAPFTEELFYRGFLFGGLARQWGVVWGGVASGALFAVAHLDPGSIVPFAIIGVVFAFVYYRSRSLFASVGAHMMFNAIAVAGTLIDRGVG